MFVSRVLLCAVVLLATAAGHAGETLDAVKSRRVLKCGVSEGIVGFSAKDASGRWRGMDADFCRAVAAAALGNADKVEFVPLSASARFPALQGKMIDVLVRQTTWTLGREAALKARFAGILFYDGQGFMVARKNAPKTVSALKDATVCVEKGTTHADNLVEYFAGLGMKVRPMIVDSTREAAAAFFAGRCRVYSSDASQLFAIRAMAPADGGGYVILPERISKEPLGPVVRDGDEDWLTLVRWVLNVLIAADEYNVTRDNVAKLIRDPTLKRVLGAADEFSKALGVEPGWSLRVLQSVGNYGEMFDRNLGAGSALKLEPGLNRPYNQGGIMYAPPLR
jgi:general L-amino acid transport system substrate-binding protein